MRRNFPEEYEEVVAAKHPKTSKYRRGRDFEYAVMKDMQGKGYLAVRSPASKSPADIYCFAKGSLVFIQCKLGGLIGVGEWNESLRLRNVGRGAPDHGGEGSGGHRLPPD